MVHVTKLSSSRVETRAAAVDRLLADELARQEAEARRGCARRRTVRVRRAVAVELEWPTGRARTLTMEIGTGGFSVLLGTPPRAGEVLAALVHLRRGAPVRATVRVASLWRRAAGAVRVSLAITEMLQHDRVALEAYVAEELRPALRQAG
jgi:hypothetical protein